MNINESNEKNELDEQELEQVAGGNAHVERVAMFRFRCPKCFNVRNFTNTIGSTVCDCGTDMVPVPLD